MHLSYTFLFFSMFLFFGCNDELSPTLFQRIPTSKSGLAFANRVTENDTFNILDFEYVYNGGGVGAADFNGDGLTDLYFAGNTTTNRLYLNKGNLEFLDVTDLAGVAAEGRWCSGITVADVDGDGNPDLYVNATIYEPGYRRTNLLFLNTGTTSLEGVTVPTFTEVAAQSGIADTSHSTQSAFFDYDRDGDLDLYVLVNEMDNRAIPNRYLPKITDGTGRKNDRFYRNDGIGTDGLPHFTEVTREAGIIKEGFGLGISVCDVNADGWPDLYITNDYLSNDLLWINNQDGTFTDRAPELLKHSSYSAMGNDVADLNGDGREDFFSVDMFPENNLRRKAMMPPNNYNTYVNNRRFGYYPQFARNALQLNRTDSDGDPVMTDVGMMAGVSATDWSWSPLAADVDNDGDRDLLITNGFPRDVTDRDFMDYNVQMRNLASAEDRLAQIPSVKISNYAYENDGQTIPHFTNRTVDWGFDYPSFSNGAVYADLDNDGDLDYVVNNINDSCFLFRNDLITPNVRPDSSHWLQLDLAGDGLNSEAIGARVIVHSDAGRQTAYNSPVRGFLSSVADVLHFGLPGRDSLLTVEVEWPDGSYGIYKDVKWDRRTTLNQSEGQPLPTQEDAPSAPAARLVAMKGMLDELPDHQDSLFIDFNVQPLLPHQLSEYGPGLAVADVNGDGLEDLYRGGSHFHPGRLLLQGTDAAGGPVFHPAPFPESQADIEELGCLFFDADGDGDEDLYLVSGGSELSLERPELLDHLMLNDGSGNFSESKGALPEIHSSGSCVRAADYDRDGDLDLFVGGRLLPGRFPQPVDSYLLRNDGQGSFAPASSPDLEAFGLVTDALWTDYNNDGWVDLLIAGQGMGLRLLENRQGRLEDATPAIFDEHVGWWNGLAAGDFDRDGDVDYVAGNFGANHLYGNSGSDYVGLYGGDLDGNGGYDLLVTDYSLAEDGTYKEFPHNQRTDTEKQLISVKHRFPRHELFGKATIDDVLKQYPDAEITVLRSNYLRSAWIENLGSGDFTFHELPRAAQVAPIFGMQPVDVNGDGYTDLVAIGNEYGTETGMGMLDALNGLLLTFDPEAKDFVVKNADDFYVPGNGRSLTLIDAAGTPTLIAAENNGPTTAYGIMSTGLRAITLPPDAQRMTYLLGGKPTVSEVYYGNGYLSQRSRTLWLPAGASDLRIVTFGGTTEAPIQ